MSPECERNPRRPRAGAASRTRPCGNGAEIYPEFEPHVGTRGLSDTAVPGLQGPRWSPGPGRGHRPGPQTFRGRAGPCHAHSSDDAELVSFHGTEMTPRKDCSSQHSPGPLETGGCGVALLRTSGASLVGGDGRDRVGLASQARPVLTDVGRGASGCPAGVLTPGVRTLLRQVAPTARTLGSRAEPPACTGSPVPGVGALLPRGRPRGPAARWHYGNVPPQGPQGEGPVRERPALHWGGGSPRTEVSMESGHTAAGLGKAPVWDSGPGAPALSSGKGLRTERTAAPTQPRAPHSLGKNPANLWSGPAVACPGGSRPPAPHPVGELRAPGGEAALPGLAGTHSPPQRARERQALLENHRPAQQDAGQSPRDPAPSPHLPAPGPLCLKPAGQVRAHGTHLAASPVSSLESAAVTHPGPRAAAGHPSVCGELGRQIEQAKCSGGGWKRHEKGQFVRDGKNRLILHILLCH